MLFDAHTHFFSHSFFLALVHQAARASGRTKEELLEDVETKTEIELPRPSTIEHTARWLEDFQKHGVDRAVTFSSLPPEQSTVLKASAASDGRLIPFLVCDTSRPAGIQAAIDGLREGGRGLLLFPAILHFDPCDTRLDSLYEEAAAWRAPVVVSCGILQIKLRDMLGVRPTYDLRFANPLGVSAAAERHRQVKFVLPHFGAGYFAEALMAGAQSPNVYVDTSSSNSWMRAQPTAMDLQDVFRRSLDVFGPERILFGTDSSTFPRGWRNDIYAEQRDALDALGVDEGVKQRIFGENLVELLGG